ncbi:GNAT family N-acetyltransferase [Bifidobacterium jacchi]|uniref:GNAT family N-acetyltransferase n=1 Tax=Bifidobacterium jacchi TaxID=2490545 RepID=A0A5N5RMZ2_9BIFI|nr:GNAT family N-acetyltransferase [Bifidobacterium jacchi]KAB5608705.1 GNAT family N-acetyltransferase [Bifidobacterium jacchi]
MIISLDRFDRQSAVRAIRSLETELFGRHAWSENAIRQELDAPARTYLFDVSHEAASVPDTAEGTGCGIADAPMSLDVSDVRGFAGYWFDGDDAEIMDIGVAKAYQRRGIASALMTRMIDSAREQHAHRMLLEVSVLNEPAIALYRRFGFTPIGLRRRYYQPEGIDAHVMALDLNPRIVGFSASGGINRGTDGGAGGDAGGGGNTGGNTTDSSDGNDSGAIAADEEQ